MQITEVIARVDAVFTDNLAATVLARAAGLDLFGYWEVIDIAGTSSPDPC